LILSNVFTFEANAYELVDDPVADGILSGLVALQGLLQQDIKQIGDEISNQTSIKFQGDTLLHQGNANAINMNTQQVAAQQAAALITARTLLPAQSTAAVTAQALQARAKALSAVKGAIRAFSQLGTQKGTGVSANEAAPAASGSDLCGFMGNGWTFLDNARYGDLASKIKCSSGGGSPSNNNIYVNAETMISSVVGPLQYPIPQNVTITPDKHILFNNAVATPNSTWKDEVRFVAAWKFCEQQIVTTTPVVGTNRNLTTNDITAIMADIHNAATSPGTDAFQTCIASIAYRTACPQNSAFSQSGGDGASCYSKQKDMCHALKDPISIQPGVEKGLGIDTIGDDEADSALKDCDNSGLSVAMFDKIMSHKCANYNTVSALGSSTGGIGADVDKAMASCPGLQQAFDQKLLVEEQTLREAIGRQHPNF